MPDRIPIAPPTTLSTTASIRNCCWTSPFGGADGHADADLASAFGDRHQHDIHDADAADEQRNAGDRGQQYGEQSRILVGQVSHVGQVAHEEVVVLSGANAVAVAQQRRDLLLRGVAGVLREPRKP